MTPLMKGRLGLVALVLVLLPPAGTMAWEPVKLIPYPQKVRTFYSLGDTQTPWAAHVDSPPFPVGNVTAAARATDGAMWLGTTQGLMRLDFPAPPLPRERGAPTQPRSATFRWQKLPNYELDRLQYLSGLRYLPDDKVTHLLPDAHGGVWVRTETGISHIELRSMTLEKKAEVFEQRIRERHDRYGLVADCVLTRPGDTSSHEYIDNDNDGLWTSIYAAAECFRYRVTKSPEALANARKSINAMLFLEEVAGRRGFPARSYIRKGDRMPQGGEWHWTADGRYYWKGDTSSDEIVGHFFMFSIAYDLLRDAELKRRIAQTTKRIMDHILDHGYTLVDLDGKPTTWGWWSPEKLAEQPDERALNSLQLLSFLKTAAHICGDPRYEAEYQKAAWQFKYADWITHVNDYRQELNYSDEELALLPFYCVFQYESDPTLLQTYRRALDEWWKNIQREANPLWTFIYLTGQPTARIDLAPAVWTLYRTPMDMIKWNVRNSQRQDLEWAPGRERSGEREVLNLLAPDERPIMRWNSNPFVVDGGGNGQEEDDGAAFLLPYWMGRYHKFLRGK